MPVMEIRLDDGTTVDRTETTKLGVQVLELPEGAAVSNDATSCTGSVIENPETGERAVMLVMVAEHMTYRLGAHVVLNPNQARALATGILAGADQVESHNQGRPN